MHDTHYSSEHHRQLLSAHMHVYRDVAQRYLELDDMNGYYNVCSIYPLIIRWHAASYVHALKKEQEHKE